MRTRELDNVVLLTLSSALMVLVSLMENYWMMHQVLLIVIFVIFIFFITVRVVIVQVLIVFFTSPILITDHLFVVTRRLLVNGIFS